MIRQRRSYTNINAHYEDIGNDDCDYEKTFNKQNGQTFNNDPHILKPGCTPNGYHDITVNDIDSNTKTQMV